MRREFCHNHIVRYDEGNCHAILTPAAFLRYMQDIAALDAEDAQLGGDGLWVVKRTVISFTAPVPVHTRLTLKTFGLGFSRITAHRGYEAYRADAPESDPLIVARTLWVYLDARGRPTRLPERTADIWLPDEPRPPLPEPPLPAPPDYAPEISTATVPFSAIDQAGHLNNAAAVEILDDAAWQHWASKGVTPVSTRLDPVYYDIEYGDSPLFGETLTIQSWLTPFETGEQPSSRIQHVMRGEKVAVRAHSRWLSRP